MDEAVKRGILSKEKAAEILSTYVLLLQIIQKSETKKDLLRQLMD